MSADFASPSPDSVSLSDLRRIQVCRPGCRSPAFCLQVFNSFQWNVFHFISFIFLFPCICTSFPAQTASLFLVYCWSTAQMCPLAHRSLLPEDSGSLSRVLLFVSRVLCEQRRAWTRRRVRRRHHDSRGFTEPLIVPFSPSDLNFFLL